MYIMKFSEANGTSRLEVQIMSRFSDHSCTVWRVSWNLTGTILSSSGDDGCVRMWKSNSIDFIWKINFKYSLFHSIAVNYLKHWKCAAILKQDGSQSPQDSSINPSVAPPSTTLATTKYYKRGNLSHPNEVLLHWWKNILQYFFVNWWKWKINKQFFVVNIIFISLNFLYKYF